jgi:hypothetical protein
MAGRTGVNATYYWRPKQVSAALLALAIRLWAAGAFFLAHQVG